MLAFPISGNGSLPWAHQPIMEPVWATLGALAVNTASYSAVIVASVWVTGTLMLTILVATQHHREDGYNALPVKVRAVTAV